MRIQTLILFSSLAIFPLASQAIDDNEVPEKQKTVYGLYLTPFEAYNMKTQQADAVLFIDVRTRAELKFIGTSALIDANIPSRFLNTNYTWSDKNDSYRTSVNDHFIADVEKLLKQTGKNRSTPVILMCQSGSRVPKAAQLLFDAGFKTVYSQYQGFEGSKASSGVYQGQRVINGWKNAGLPWSYHLNKAAMYFNFDSTQTEAGD